MRMNIIFLLHEQSKEVRRKQRRREGMEKQASKEENAIDTKCKKLFPRKTCRFCATHTYLHRNRNKLEEKEAKEPKAKMR